MSDEHIIVIGDGSRFRPSTSVDRLQCHHCDNCGRHTRRSCLIPRWQLVLTVEQSWTAETKRHTAITVTAPEAISGEA
jgi:ribosomal protein S26